MVPLPDASLISIGVCPRTGSLALVATSTAAPLLSSSARSCTRTAERQLMLVAIASSRGPVYSTIAAIRSLSWP